MVEFHREFHRRGVIEKRQKTLFIVASEQSPAIAQVGIVFYQIENAVVQLQALGSEPPYSVAPDVESVIRFADPNPRLPFLQIQLWPVWQQIAGDGKVAHCFRAWAIGGRFSESSLEIGFPV